MKSFSAVVEILREISVGDFKQCIFKFTDRKEMFRFLDHLRYDPSFIKLVSLKYA